MPARSKARIRTVAVVARPRSQPVARKARSLAAWLARRKVAVLGDEGWVKGGKSGSEVRVADRRAMMKDADLVVVLGGDGSLIGVARLSTTQPVPVIGFHHGEFGFLTEGERGDMYTTLERVLAGDFTVNYRALLGVTLQRREERIVRSQALNDAVINYGAVSRLISLDVAVDDQHLAAYKGDGLVIATPTGSTAYSLSAGGPVVEPTMGATLITPISPHTLSIRPVVVPDRSRIRVTVPGDCRGAVLTLDGQEWFSLEPGDVVEATKSRRRAAIVDNAGDGFFDVLRRKLHWGARGDGSGASSPRDRRDP